MPKDYKKGDIIYTYFSLPNQGIIKEHPILIISDEEMFINQEVYIGVMMTHMKIEDEHTFEITDDMLYKKTKDDAFMQVRLHLVTYLQEKDCNNYPFNSMKPIFIDEIIKELKMRL